MSYIKNILVYILQVESNLVLNENFSLLLSNLAFLLSCFFSVYFILVKRTLQTSFVVFFRLKGIIKEASERAKTTRYLFFLGVSFKHQVPGTRIAQACLTFYAPLLHFLALLHNFSKILFYLLTLLSLATVNTTTVY